MPWKFNPFTATLDYYEAGSTSVATANIKARVSPVESPDGSTTTFTVPDTYLSGSLTVYLNGLAEYFVTETTTTTFTFDTAPISGDDIKLQYAVEA